MATRAEVATEQLTRQPATERSRRLGRQLDDNLGYTLEVWEELLQKHKGQWIMVWGERQVLIGDDIHDMLASVPESVRPECLARFIAPLPEFI
jgi:trehalose/maltose hydrolase-like predicted phosphorylase